MKHRLSDVLKASSIVVNLDATSAAKLGSYLDAPQNPFGKRLRATIRAIESVHRVSNLRPIPVEESRARDENGRFHIHLATGTPVAIEISTRGDRPELTLAHEVGHFLETTAIPGHNFGNRRWAFDSNMAGFMGAVLSTRAVRELRKLNDETQDVVLKANAAYRLQSRELWARCYAQYVSMRSQNPVLLDQLEKKRSQDSLLPIQSQWENDDFEIILEAIDKLLSTIGWRQ